MGKPIEISDDLVNEYYSKLLISCDDRHFELKDVMRITGIAAGLVKNSKLDGKGKKEVVTRIVDRFLGAAFPEAEAEIGVALAVVDTGIDVLIDAYKGKFDVSDMPRSQCLCYSAKLAVTYVKALVRDIRAHRQ